MATAPTASELRIAIFGKSKNEQTTLSDFISGKKDQPHPTGHIHRGWRKKPVVVKTADVFSLPVEKVKHQMKRCVAHCPPGPNVLLLLVRPSDFTEQDRQKIKFIMNFFGQDAFQYSMVIVTQNDRGENSSLNQLIQDCRQRQHRMNFDQNDFPDYDRKELMGKMEIIADKNRGRYLTFTEHTESVVAPECAKPPLNLVLCGTHGALKSSTASAILGKRKFGLLVDTSECVKHQGEVGGRWVSLVELPALYGKPQQAVKNELLKCISLCDPEGVHFFVLVLPVGTQSEEDQKELETIQDIFSSRVNDFTMVLFAMEANLSFLVVERFLHESSEIIQRCGGRYAICNIKDRQEVSEVLHAVGTKSVEERRSFTKDMFPKPQTNPVTRRASSAESFEHHRGQFQRMTPSMTSFRDAPRKEPPSKGLGRPFPRMARSKESLKMAPNGESPSMASSRESSSLPLSRESPSLASSKESSSMASNREPLRMGSSKESSGMASNREPLRMGSNKESSSMASNREPLRMVLMGKTGCGKSATGNTILGKHCFDSRVCLTSVTRLCQKATGEIDGRPVAVVDTPGLFDTTLTNEEVQQEIKKCVSLLAPGPHVFLLVLEIGRFTQEQRDAVELIKASFGEKSEDYIVIIFTRGDELNETIESYIGDSTDNSLRDLTNECGRRYLVFNNTDRENRSQVKQLLTMVESMVKKNGGHYYTTELFQGAEAAIQKEKEKILRAKEQEMWDLVRKHQKELQEKEKKLAELTAKLDLEREERAKEKLAEEEERKREQRKKEKETNKKRQEELQRRKWEEKLQNLEEKLKYVSKENALSDWVSLLRVRDELNKDREAWEQEQRDRRYREDQRRREEEEKRLKKLRDEHLKDENKKKEDDIIRREHEERESKMLKELFEKKILEMRRTNEEEARKQAEEYNEFSIKYTKGVWRNAKEREALKQRQRNQNDVIIRGLSRNIVYQKDIKRLKKNQEEEMKDLKAAFCLHNGENLSEEMNKLEQKHEEEIDNWIQDHLKKATQDQRCSIL